MSKITVKQKFNAPVQQVFDLLSQHATYNQVFVPFQIVRIQESSQVGQPDGLGSIRAVGLGRYKPLKEQITIFEENRRIEYQIIGSKWIKYHLGRIDFQEITPTTTEVTYSIELEAKIPWVHKLILAQLKTAITLGFAKLAKSIT